MGDVKEKYEDFRDLATEVNRIKQELIEVVAKFNIFTCALVGASDLLKMEAMDVIEEESGGMKVKNMKYNTPKASAEEAAATVPTGKRKCSNCGEYGHNARTCTSKKGMDKRKGKE